MLQSAFVQVTIHHSCMFEPAVLQYSTPEQVKDCTESKQLLVGPLAHYEFVCLSKHTHHLNNQAMDMAMPHTSVQINVQ